MLRMVRRSFPSQNMTLPHEYLKTVDSVGSVIYRVASTYIEKLKSGVIKKLIVEYSSYVGFSCTN